MWLKKQLAHARVCLSLPSPHPNSKNHFFMRRTSVILSTKVVGRVGAAVWGRERACELGKGKDERGKISKRQCPGTNAVARPACPPRFQPANQEQESLACHRGGVGGGNPPGKNGAKGHPKHPKQWQQGNACFPSLSPISHLPPPEPPSSDTLEASIIKWSASDPGE